MGLLFVLLLQLTLLLGSAGAHTPVMDPSLSPMPSGSFYPDPDGMFGPLCQACEMMVTAAGICLCMLSSPPRPPTLPAPTSLDNPQWEGNPTLDFRTPSPEPEPPINPRTYPTIEEAAKDATTVQYGTVDFWNEQIYTPGDRTLKRKRPRKSSQRQPNRPNGYLCMHLGCDRTFHRHCDLKRHEKTHLESSERPHQCSFCPRGFLYPKDLDRHEITHSSSPPLFFCKVEGCTRTQGFPRKDNLKRHVLNQHPGEIFP